MIIIASNNLEKSVEITDFLNILNIESINYQHIIEKQVFPNEGITSLKENAVNKCLFLSKLLPDYTLLSDDTGLFLPSYPHLFGIETKRDFHKRGFFDSEAQNNHVIDLCNQANDFNAQMHVGVSLYRQGKIYTELVQVPYKIAKTPTGEYSTGFDRILSVNGRTLAEMPISERFNYAHRAIALKKIKKWLFV